MTQDTKIRLAVLQELANTPAAYLQPLEALRASTRLLVVPPPADAAIEAAITRLENDGLITRADSALRGPRYAITDAGRAALNS